MTVTVPYPIIDADAHYYEPDDAFSRHIDPKFRDMAIRIVPGGWDVRLGGPNEDIGRWIVGDRYISFNHRSPAHHQMRPGAFKDFLVGKQNRSEVDLESVVISPLVDLREALDREARLGWMDAHDVEATLMLPTQGVAVAHDLHDMPDVLHANLRSFNRWVEEDWGFGSDQRIFGVPAISLVGVDEAVAELERVAALGAKFFYTKLGPVYGKSPADPEFDRFWAAAQDTGMHLILHVDNSGYTEMISPLWGEPANVPNLQYSAFQLYSCLVERPVQDTLASLILHNLFGRFPRLQVLVIECGSTWVAPLLRDIDKAWKMSTNSWFGGKVEDKPSDIFRDRIYISPFPEEDVPALATLVSADHVLFGSDWPHPEGVAEPSEYFEHLDGMSDDDIRKIMRDNTAALLGLVGAPAHA
jgi:predicted TIM-barrel fold metal-dependent hydrolase